MVRTVLVVRHFDYHCCFYIFKCTFPHLPYKFRHTSPPANQQPSQLTEIFSEMDLPPAMNEKKKALLNNKLCKQCGWGRKEHNYFWFFNFSIPKNHLENMFKMQISRPCLQRFGFHRSGMIRESIFLTCILGTFDGDAV